MEYDYIRIKKSQNDYQYEIDIYFSSIDGTFTIKVAENDFIKLLSDSVNLVNDTSKRVKLIFPEDWKLVADENEFKKKIADLRSHDLLTVRPEAELIIYIPDAFIEIFVAENLTNAAGGFMEALGFEIEIQEEPVFGSFFQKIKFIFSEKITEDDLNKIYDKGKKALELKYVNLPTAEETEKLANAAKSMVSTLDSVSEGIVRLGNLIVIKKDVNGQSKIIVQQLSFEMVTIIETHPKLILNLQTMYELLTGDVNIDI